MNSPCACEASKKRQDGFSLVEILVSTLLLMLVFIFWVVICNFQAIRKESLRRIAIEKGAGYLDYMAASYETGMENKYWGINFDYDDEDETEDYRPEDLGPGDLEPTVQALFDDEPVIGYTLKVTDDLPVDVSWTPGAKWAIITLYDLHGVVASEAGRPFSIMSMYLSQ